MQNTQGNITQHSNSFTTHIITHNLHQTPQSPTQPQKQNQQQETPFYQGESSSSQQNKQTAQQLPQFFVYPEEIIQEGVSACSRSIIGKIITDKSIHIRSIQNGLESIWGSPSGLKVQEIEGKLLQFFMDKEEDQDRILNGNPWIFRNSWIIVKPWDRETNLTDLDFENVPVWVQLWGFPTHCKTKPMGASLGSLMGTVEAAEFYEYPGKKIIIKVKVHINVHKPLTSGIHIGNPNDGNCWVDFRYEKLPLICFKCGLVGHEEKLCRRKPMILGTLAPLGPWIRSTQYGKRKIEAKDKNYYSNPSHDPKFGQHSPPVPKDLLDQLAAMKLHQQMNESNMQQNQHSPTQNTTHTNHNYGQGRVQQLIECHTTRTQKDPTAATSTKGQLQLTPAKRQKMEQEEENVLTRTQTEGVGHAQQASPRS
jgi:hypothetical protein